jgi:hypothetical protein
VRFPIFRNSPSAKAVMYPAALAQAAVQRDTIHSDQ